MNATVFSNVTIQNGASIRVYALLENKCLDITILKSENAWKKVLHWGDLEAIASIHELNLDNYCETLLDYLKYSNPNIECTLSNNEFLVTRILESGLKVKYFTCKLYKANYVELTEEMLDKFYSENLDNSKKLDESIRKCEEYKQHEEACELKLKELLGRQKVHDDELFNHFMLILNEKKARIKHLSELLAVAENGGPPIVEKAPVKGQGKKRKTNKVVEVPKVIQREVVSESDSEEQEDVNTDEEIETGHHIHEENIEEPSTSRQTDHDTLKQENAEKKSTSILDFLFDAPSLSGLTKRQKIDEEKNIEIQVIPKMHNEKTEVVPEPVIKERKAAVVELNTQQLLDML